MKREFANSYALDHIVWDRSKEYSSGQSEAIGLEEEYTPPDIVTSAENAATIMNELGFTADFSIDSLAEMDRCFAEKVNSETPGYRDLFADDLTARCFDMGAYLGEVLRRQRGGEWQGDASDPLIHVNLELQLPDESVCRPMKQILKRLNAGAQESFVAWAQKHGIADAIPAAACEVPVSSADFPIRGNVTLWHYPNPDGAMRNYHVAADATACVNLLAYFSFLESHAKPSIKSITTVQKEYAVTLPQFEGRDGELLNQLVLFFDRELDANHWSFAEVPDGLHLEFGVNGLTSLKAGVDQMFLETGEPIIGTENTFLHFWSKSKLA